MHDCSNTKGPVFLVLYAAAIIVGYCVYLVFKETNRYKGIPIPQYSVQPRSPLSWLNVSVKVDTATVFTTGGYHMSRDKPRGMISAFV